MKYRSPFTKSAKCTCVFKKEGSWAAGYHTGEDWVYVDNDTKLVSPCAGKVLRNEFSSSYGNFVVLGTNDGKVILMAHMATRSPLKVGATVKQGDLVGTIGNTGNSFGVHLHIEVQNSTVWSYNKNLLKPSDYIDFADFTNEVTPTNNGGFEVKAYQNGSTKEYVYKTIADCETQNKLKSIGSLNPREICECYGIINGYYLVVYTAGNTKKTGFVKFAGGVK